jgi:hypothetical protein
MKYYSYVAPPSLDGLSLEHTPRPGLAVSIVTFWFHATGQSGTHYNLIRAVGMPEQGSVLNFGIYRGSDDLDVRAELVIPVKEHPVVESCWMERSDTAVVYGGPSFQIEMGLDEYRWRDADDRIDLRAQRHGGVCSLWVPPQENFEHGFLDCSQIGKLTGTIDGDPVEGMFVDDHVYAKPGSTLPEAGLVSKVENYWTQWWVEYDDGSIEAGTAWRGRPGTGLGHAHHYVDGRSRARRDARIDVSRNQRGSMKHVVLSLGSDVRFEFEQTGSFDWPLHTYGHVSSSSRGRGIAKSWNYVENWPLNMHLIEDYQIARERLYGRPASLKRLLEGAQVVDEALVLVSPDRDPARA